MKRAALWACLATPLAIAAPQQGGAGVVLDPSVVLLVDAGEPGPVQEAAKDHQAG